MITNLSAAARAIDDLGKAVFKDIGDSLAKGVMEEFEQLVIETPQWTGTAAASWNVSMGGDHSVREQPVVSRQEALAKGHSTAVGIAMAHNQDALNEISIDYLRKDLVVENHAGSASHAESGPLRPVNEPGEAFERFKERVAVKMWPVIKSRKI